MPRGDESAGDWKGGLQLTHCYSLIHLLIHSHPLTDHPSQATHCPRCWDAPWVTILDKIPPVESQSVFPPDPQAESSLGNTVAGHLAPAGRNRKSGSVGRLQTVQAWPQIFPFLTPLLISCSHPSTRVLKAQSALSFPQDPSCKATKMSRLCLSVALLVLLGTLMACIPGCDTSNQAKGKSWLISPLKVGVREEGSP